MKSEISHNTLVELGHYIENGDSIGKLLRMVFSNRCKKLVSDLKLVKVELNMTRKANAALADRMRTVCETLDTVRGQHRGAASEVQRLTKIVEEKKDE